MTIKKIPSQSEQFVDALVAAFCKFQTNVDLRATKRIYSEKLAKWKLSGAQWTEALDRIIGACEKNELPSLGLIYGYLKAVIAEAATTAGEHWISFDLNGLRYARKIVDPQKLPELPIGASSARLSIDAKLQAYTAPCSKHEARLAFVDGFLNVGGECEDLARMFAAVDRAVEDKSADHKGGFTQI